MDKLKLLENKIRELDSNLRMGNVHQFTIDYLETLSEDINLQRTGENGVEDETYLNATEYHLENVLEIMRPDTEDYLIIQSVLSVLK